MSTGNDLRDAMIRNAIQKVTERGDPLNLPIVQMELPDDFDLSQAELNDFAPKPKSGVPNGTPDGSTASNEAVDGSTVSHDTVDEADDLPPMTQAEAREMLVRLNDELSQERGNVITLTTRVRQARERVAKAIAAFQAGFVPVTREQLQREHIASEQARKAAGHPSMRGQSMPGPSVVDQAAFRGSRSVNRSYSPKYRRPGLWINGTFHRTYGSEVKGARVPSDR